MQNRKKHMIFTRIAVKKRVVYFSTDSHHVIIKFLISAFFAEINKA